MVSTPELKKYLNKRLSVLLNGDRRLEGSLRGYDLFLNITLEDTVELPAKEPIGTVVVRGNSVVSIEVLDNL